MISGASTAGSTLPTEPQVCCRNIAPTAISITVKWRNSFRWRRSRRTEGARGVNVCSRSCRSASVPLGSEAEQANYLTRGSQSPRIVTPFATPCFVAIRSVAIRARHRHPRERGDLRRQPGRSVRGDDDKGIRKGARMTTVGAATSSSTYALTSPRALGSALLFHLHVAIRKEVEAAQDRPCPSRPRQLPAGAAASPDNPACSIRAASSIIALRFT